MVRCATEKDKLVSEKMAELIGSNRDLRAEFCNTLSLTRLRIACYVAGLHAGKVYMTNSDGQKISVSRAAAHSFVDRDSEEILRRYLLERLETSHELSAQVALRVMYTEDVRNLVNRALENTETWLRSEKPNLFENCDRLKSEGEFRRGVSVPLALALCSICSLYTSDMITIWLPALPVFFLYLSGLRKIAEANAIVVGCVGVGIAPIKLDISDTKLLRWPTTQNSTADSPSRLSALRTFWRTRRRSSDQAPPSDV